MGRYNDEHFEEALREFHAAYDLRQKPILLYNIAQCHRRLGQAREAVYYYRRYAETELNLTEDMKAKVQAYVEELSARLTARSDTGPAPASPAAMPVTPPRPPGQTPPVLTNKLGAMLRPSPPPPSRPIYKRWWFWSAVGAVAAGGVAGIIAATYRRDSGFPPGVNEVIGADAWSGHK